MRISVYQGDGKMADVASNLRLIRRIAADAAGRGARLVIFPEMFLTGYNIGPAVRDLAEPSDGPAVESLGEFAREAKIALLCGYPERAPDGLYNAALMVDRDGRVIANYRKNHLFGDYEKAFFKPGDGLVSTELDGLKVGVLICYDIEFPEPARALALDGVAFVAVPTSLMTPNDPVARTLVPARACENQIFVAYANRCGREGDLSYIGQSCVVGPDGRDLARAAESDELLVADIDIEAIAASRRPYNYLADRRPALYRALT